MGIVIPGPGAGEAPPAAKEPNWHERAAVLFDQVNVLPVSEGYRALAIVCVASALRVAYFDGCIVAATHSQELFALARNVAPPEYI